MSGPAISVLLVHDDSGLDPVANLMGAGSRPDLELVPLSAFLRRLGVRYDAIGGCLVQEPDTAAPGLPPGARLVDRVSEVSVQTARALTSDDLAAAPDADDVPLPTTAQVQQAYEQLIGDRAALPAVRQYSTLGRMLPLTSQWYLAREALPHLAIPDFKSGYGPEPIDATGIEQPIWKSPFDFYAWQPNQRPEGPIWDALVVGRPPGMPVLVYGQPDDLVVSALGAGAPDALEAVLPLLTDDSARILRLFGFGIGEVLWFVAQQQCVFAACSPLLYGCARQPDFAAVVDRFIDRLAEPAQD